jgi:hypothetical protein
MIKDSAVAASAPATTGVHCKYPGSSTNGSVSSGSAVRVSNAIVLDLHRNPNSDKIAMMTTTRPIR